MSNSDSNVVSPGKDTRDVILTDNEVNAALERLYMAVKNEPVPEEWTVPDAEGSRGYGEIDRCESVQSLPLNRDATKTLFPLDASNSEFKVTSESHRHGKRGTAKHKRFGRIATTVAAAVMLIGFLASPLGNKAIADAMKTMYFNNIVGVGQDDLSQIERAFASSGSGKINRIDLKQYGSVVVSGRNLTQSNVTLDEAVKRTGLPAKVLPGYNPKQDTMYYTPERDVTFRLNASAINSLIGRLGGTKEFPSSVDGESIVIRIPAQLGEQVTLDGGKYASLTELKSPVVEVPSDVDLNKVRDALLSLPFLPLDIRQSLSQSENWTNTVYVPVGGKVTNLTIDGNPAVLETGSVGSDTSIFWLEHGVIYQLTGSPSYFTSDDALVAEAKELAQ